MAEPLASFSGDLLTNEKSAACIMVTTGNRAGPHFGMADAVSLHVGMLRSFRSVFPRSQKEKRDIQKECQP